MNTKELDATKLKQLKFIVKQIYVDFNHLLPFHGLHHIIFVVNKSLAFASSLAADPFLVESAAWTHDLNYIVTPNSKAQDGQRLRIQILSKAGYTESEIEDIEKIINEASTKTRNAKISSEAKALSDADTVFKVLPVTPILFTLDYLKENEVSIADLAHKIISEQERLIREGIFFYSSEANNKYLEWATINLALWNGVSQSFNESDIIEMLQTAGKF